MKIVKDLTLIAIFASIIIVLEYALYFLPNVQLTFLLIILYSKVLGLKKTTLIIILYVMIDYLILGGLSFYTPVALVGFLLIPILLTTIFKKVEESLILACLGVVFSFIYSWLYALATVLLTEVNLFAYLASDILFEIILACSTFVSVLWLYKPLKKFLIDKV